MAKGDFGSGGQQKQVGHDSPFHHMGIKSINFHQPPNSGGTMNTGQDMFGGPTSGMKMPMPAMISNTEQPQPFMGAINGGMNGGVNSLPGVMGMGGEFGGGNMGNAGTGLSPVAPSNPMEIVRRLLMNRAQ